MKSDETPMPPSIVASPAARKSVRIETDGKLLAEIVYRPGTSDESSINQVFGQQMYSFGQSNHHAAIRKVHESIIEAGAKPLILDLGANIGVSAVYFHLDWPGSHIVAIEPALDNVEILRLNSAALPSISPVHAGIANTDGALAIIDPTVAKWCYRTTPVAPGTAGAVPAVSVNSLLTEWSPRRGFVPFIAKIDIEGSELELFSAHTEWVDLFPVVIVEPHDWMLVGAAGTRTFLRTIAALDRDLIMLGESLISIRNNRH